MRLCGPIGSLCSGQVVPCVWFGRAHGSPMSRMTRGSSCCAYQRHFAISRSPLRPQQLDQGGCDGVGGLGPFGRMAVRVAELDRVAKEAHVELRRRRARRGRRWLVPAGRRLPPARRLLFGPASAGALFPVAGPAEAVIDTVALEQFAAARTRADLSHQAAFSLSARRTRVAGRPPVVSVSITTIPTLSSSASAASTSSLRR